MEVIGRAIVKNFEANPDLLKRKRFPKVNNRRSFPKSDKFYEEMEGHWTQRAEK